MTPNFALSLSFEGIRLLRRVTGGWHLVGEVTLETPDLGGALKVLRQTALELDPAGLRTKLLIPNEQIKYTAIDSTQTDLDDVHAALDGLTPYSIHDLVIDYDRTGGRTHIAAVARETLQEAEAFALEHNFAPVCFAAVSPPFTFSGEVFFGPTKAANDILGAETPVTRDGEAVVVIGAVAMTEPEPVADPTPVTGSQADTPLVLDQESEGDDNDAVVDVLFASRHRETVEDAPQLEEAPATPAPPVVAEPEPTPAVEPLFTRRKESPKDAVPKRSEPPLTAAKAPKLEPVVEAPAPPPPIVTPKLEEDIAPPPPVVADPIVRPAPLPDRGEAPAPVKPTAEAETMTVFGARNGAKVGGKPKYLGLMLTTALLIFMLLVALFMNTATEDGLAGLFKRDPQLIETTDVPTPVIQAPTETVAQEPVAETPAPPVLRQPVGRVLSADEANRIYAATGVYQRAPRFTSVPRETSIEGFQAASAIAALEPMAPLAAPDLDAMVPDAPLTPPANPPAPGIEFPRDLRGFILATPEGTITPEGAFVIAGAPERRPPARPGSEVIVATPAPATVAPAGEEGLILIAGRPPIVPPLRPASIAPDDEANVAPEAPVEIVVETAEAATTQLPEIDDAAAAAIVAEALAAAQNDPAPAPVEEEVVAGLTEALQEEVLTPDVALAEPEEAATPEDIAATDPTPETPDDVIVIAGRPDIVPNLRPDDLVVPEQEAAVLEEITPEAAEEDIATAEPGTLEDVIIVAGRPDLTPPERPASIVARAVETPALIVVNPTDVLANSGVSLATFQPRLRPATLQPPVAEPTIQSDPTLAGFRPAVRPADLAPAEEPAEEVIIEETTPDVTSVIAAITAAAPPSPIVNATAQAIVVARAQAAAQQRQAAPQPAAAAPTTQVSSAPAQPTGPVPGGVARAATVDNAIRLRDINLVGVYGRPNDRRALVRLSNGRFVKVEVGSRLDGGRVTAIGDSALNYVKSGRTYALQLPAG